MEVMKVTVEDQSSVKKVLHIEVPVDVVGRELDDAYNEMKKTVKVKGFRPGKVPRAVLERMYRKEVHADVSSKLIQEGFIAALKLNDLNVVAPPKVDPPELKEGAAYRFDALVEVRPVISDVQFKALTLNKSKYAVSDEEIDLQLKMLQRNMAQHNKVETARPVQTGDTAIIDYEGFKDGQPHAATQKTENFNVKVGEGRVVKDLDNGLVGMTAGEEKEINVTFPEDYFNKDLAGQQLVFKVKLHEIREEILPNLDDAFAKSLSDQFETLEALKSKVRDNLQSGYTKRIEQELNEQVFTHLLGQANFEVPDAMTDIELENILKDAEQSFSYSNRTLEEMGLSRESLALKYRPVAEKQVRRHLMLNKIIDQEKLTLTDEELEKGLQDMAANYGQPIEGIKAFYQKDKESLSYFKHMLLEKKALKLIIDTAVITEVEPAAKSAEN
jgi:trigger factor